MTVVRTFMYVRYSVPADRTFHLVFPEYLKRIIGVRSVCPHIPEHISVEIGACAKTDWVFTYEPANV
jgi:hypothetical protein